MNLHRFVYFIPLLLLAVLTKGKQLPPSQTYLGQLTGRLIDSTTRQAVPFATVGVVDTFRVYPPHGVYKSFLIN